MREMKDSGVSWIGEIPADWEVHKVSSSFSEKKEKNTDYEFDRVCPWNRLFSDYFPGKRCR